MNLKAARRLSRGGAAGFSCHFTIDNGPRLCYIWLTLLADGRFSRTTPKRGKGGVLFKHDLFGKPGSTFPDHALGKPRWSAGRRAPSVSPSLSGEIRRGDAAPEAQKAVTPTAWRGSTTGASRRSAPVGIGPCCWRGVYWQSSGAHASRECVALSRRQAERIFTMLTCTPKAPLRQERCKCGGEGFPPQHCTRRTDQ